MELAVRASVQNQFGQVVRYIAPYLIEEILNSVFESFINELPLVAAVA